MNKPFYDIIVNNYPENSVLTARIFQDKTVSVRIKSGQAQVYNGDDRQFIKAFIERANEKIKGKGSNQFKIAFDYKNHRLHFYVRNGGVVTTSTTQRILNPENKTEILFDNKNDIFYAKSPDIFGKFNEMRECAMGFIGIINYNLTKS